MPIQSALRSCLCGFGRLPVVVQSARKGFSGSTPVSVRQRASEAKAALVGKGSFGDGSRANPAGFKSGQLRGIGDSGEIRDRDRMDELLMFQ